MSIITRCPNPACSKRFKLDESTIGRKARCKKCGTRFVVRAEEGELVSASSQIPGEATDSAPDPGNRTFAREEQVPADWRSGDVVLDLYDVMDILGEGGFGKVYRVHHRGWKPRLGRQKSTRVDLGKTGIG